MSVSIELYVDDEELILDEKNENFIPQMLVDVSTKAILRWAKNVMYLPKDLWISGNFIIKNQPEKNSIIIFSDGLWLQYLGLETFLVFMAEQGYEGEVTEKFFDGDEIWKRSLKLSGGKLICISDDEKLFVPESIIKLELLKSMEYFLE